MLTIYEQKTFRCSLPCDSMCWWVSFSSQIFATPSNDVMMQNVEALSDSEGSGAKCPKGCRSIGWGTDKILECDCNYDHFSCCNLWGC